MRKVKRAENGMIYDPVTIDVDATVGDALRLMAQNHIGGIPVVDAGRHLIGIVTNRDLRFQDNPETPIKSVMTCEKLITVGPKTTIPEATEVLRRHRIEKLPVVDKSGRLVGLITYRDITKIKDNPKASKDSLGRLRVAAGIVVSAPTVIRFSQVITSRMGVSGLSWKRRSRLVTMPIR